MNGSGLAGHRGLWRPEKPATCEAPGGGGILETHLLQLGMGSCSRLGGGAQVASSSLPKLQLLVGALERTMAGVWSIGKVSSHEQGGESSWKLRKGDDHRKIAAATPVIWAANIGSIAKDISADAAVGCRRAIEGKQHRRMARYVTEPDTGSRKKCIGNEGT